MTSPRDQETPRALGGNVGQRLLVVAVVLFLAVGAFYGALVVATQVDRFFYTTIPLDNRLSVLPGVDTGSDEDIGGGRINILVMGLDRRPSEGEAPTRTDTMFVLTIDPAKKTAGILGIPRDLWVEIPGKEGGYLEDRINSAYVRGEVDDYDGGGPALAMETVKHNFDIDVQHYVIIDFEGFREVIDALGGIDVEVPTYLYDPEYSESELPGDYDPQEFQPGVEHMDGSRALAYARIRRGTGDLDRIQRQQRIMFAVMDKALSLNILPVALDVWREYKDAVATDINEFQIPGLAKIAAEIPQERIAALSLGPATVPYTTPAGAAVLLASEDGIREIVRALFSDQQLLDENAIVEVQNGTGEPGLATSVIDYLVSVGFPSEGLLATDSPLQSPDQLTEIVDYSGKAYTTGKLADWLGIDKDRVRAATPQDEGLRNGDADIVVVVGSDTEIDRLTTAASGG
jgi:LCP family protein required for cell wall assembly